MIKLTIMFIGLIIIFFILSLCKISKISEQKARKIFTKLDENNKNQVNN